MGEVWSDIHRSGGHRSNVQPTVRPTVQPKVRRSAERVRGAVMVIAKTPEPGRVKTRLTPPLGADDACAVAWACLADTLAAAAAVPAERHVLVLEGEPGSWMRDEFEVIAQRGTGLAERLANAFADVAATAIVIAMDTPHVEPRVLADALGALDSHDAVLGLAEDGGYWIIGLRAGVDYATVFTGVPMSTDDTGAAQLARLRALGLSILLVETMRDVDTIEDVQAIGREHPTTQLGQLVGRLFADRPISSIADAG
jgi:uncharacterized protein